MVRFLEIGCGPNRIQGFETLNIVPGPCVDYVADASKKLPFEDNSFDIIYSSHTLEHIPWYQTKNVLVEWIRVLKSGGSLEIWVPDGLKICLAFVSDELGATKNMIELDGWYKFNPKKDPCVWAAGRLFTYGDGTGNPNSPNWHRALFSARYLKELFETSGLINVKEMEHKEVRGEDHGWINLGIKGTKK